MGNEWLIPLGVIVLLFGARKLPELARSMGASIKEFRKAADQADEDDERQDETRTSSSRSDDTTTPER